MSTRPAPLLSITDLTIRFPSTPGTASVNSVSLEVLPGQTVGIVGESGSGKSTVCLAILGLLPPGTRVDGRIELDGVDVLTLPAKKMRELRGRSIGLIYQDPMAALNPVKTIGSQMRESLRYHLKLSHAEANARCVTLLEKVGITDAARKLGAYPHEFSGGMRQRVVIAMAISCNPKLIIADEPTTALDVSVQAQVLDLLRGLTAELGIALMIVSHDLGVVAGMADDVAVMRYGALVEYNSVHEVFERPQHEYTSELLRKVRLLESPAHPTATPEETLNVG
jgi:ABC-type glutathione transport system ATPase component